MTRPVTIAVVHINALCTDGATRRFYIDEGASSGKANQHGFVIFDGTETKGYVIEPHSENSRYEFVTYMQPSTIPATTGWRRHVNCSAARHCDKCRRCVGGCRK